MTDHERARELYWKIFQRKFYPSDPQDETDAAIERITEAFQAVRRAVWEEAASAVDYFNDDPSSYSAHLQRLIVDRFRAKAKEVEP